MALLLQAAHAMQLVLAGDEGIGTSAGADFAIGVRDQQQPPAARRPPALVGAPDARSILGASCCRHTRPCVRALPCAQARLMCMEGPSELVLLLLTRLPLHRSFSAARLLLRCGATRALRTRRRVGRLPARRSFAIGGPLPARQAGTRLAAAREARCLRAPRALQHARAGARRRGRRCSSRCH
jgi:hypothetical protein